MNEEVNLCDWLRDNQKKLKHTGIICTNCNKLGASAQEEADHNTGECHCATAKNLCWKEWWGKCQPKI